MERSNRRLLSLLVMAMVTTLCACNVATIDAPLNGQTHPSEPVDITILLEDSADPGSLEALLNGSNISSLFEHNTAQNILKAQVGTADGLLIGSNTLTITVVGDPLGLPMADVETRTFVVDEDGVATNRDDKGVWFITGPETASIYKISEAMGYAVATDRLWQLEQLRRSGRGRLSEILGSSFVSTDIYLRTRGYSDDELLAFFDEMDPDGQDGMRGYLDGINRRIADVRNNFSHMPIEFTLIQLNALISFSPPPVLEDWTIEDLLGWLVLFMRNFDGEAGSQRDLQNAALLQDLEDNFPSDYWDMFNDLRWLNDPDALTYIPPSGGGSILALKSASSQPAPKGAPPAFPDLRDVAAKMEATQNEVVERLKSINAYVKLGSYGWVVSGDKTLSGNPILYSGPQMELGSVPAIVLEGSIDAGGYAISGMTIPGAPGLLISRTPHHAVAFMTGHVNSVDFYIEDPGDVSFHRMETIKVLGGDDVVLPIYRTSHGPVISPMPYDPANYDEGSDGPIISWKYSHWGHDFETVRWLIDHPLAASVNEYGDAAEHVAASFHVLYADADGHIAYWMTGRDPVRPAGEWRLPQGLVAPHLEWDSEILIPRSKDQDTTQGFYSGWNNKSNPNYDAPYGPFHRAHVIHEYLSNNNGLEFEDVRDLALNIATTESFGRGGNAWRFVGDYFTDVVEANPTTERTAALALVTNWDANDGHFVAGGPTQWAWGTDVADGWILMDAWVREVIRLTFEDELGSIQDTATLFNVLLHALPGSAITNNYNWFQTPSEPTKTLDAIILAALDSTLGNLGLQPWGTGARGQITFQHPVLELLGADIVHTMPDANRSTYAQCVGYGSSGPVRIESMLPLGESGMIFKDTPLTPNFHPHFHSMTDVFDGFEHRPFPLFD